MGEPRPPSISRRRRLLSFSMLHLLTFYTSLALVFVNSCLSLLTFMWYLLHLLVVSMRASLFKSSAVVRL
ncbi:MAG: hypothetical protein EOO65_03365 [Methanosarcinales archaeon]|nr:MAG: hypothetical protein EOO65_03365 [Methanosarcinales archaeon]